jgi:energy-coupling factor transporter ATP-binding protein EcfA2
MVFTRSIKRITMNDDTSFDVEPGGVVVFVGPNNAGKSQALRNITGHFTNGKQSHEINVISEIVWRRDGEEQELRAWLATHATFQPTQQQWYRSGAAAHESWLPHAVNGPPVQQWTGFFMHYAGGEGRLQAANPTNTINFVTEPATHPLHYMYLDPDLEAKLDAVSRRVFGTGMVLNRFAGSQVFLHVGDSPVYETVRNSAPSRAFLEALAQLPQLSQQGDGMRSFMGLMLYTMTASYFVVIVDEPEAFLHPPQAYMLGRTLVEEKSATSQVVMATHSSDILRGLLDSEEADVTIVRLSREGSRNNASVLAAAEVKQLWKDPLLRYSNILDGLFHEGAIVCEGDVDCSFYSNIADQLMGSARAPQLLYTHCGGKARMPLVINSLTSVNVPTRVIADYDVLQNEWELKRILESLGADWSVFEHDYNSLKASIDQQGGSLDRSFAKQELLRILEGASTSKLRVSDVDRLRGVLKSPSGWTNAKNSGIAAVSPGDAAQSLARLLSAMGRAGLFVVPVGEVERFVKSVGGHGPAWLASVFEQNLHVDPELTAVARVFVQSVLDSFVRVGCE